MPQQSSMRPPILICGPPRSATLFHARLIGSHPEVFVTDEVNRRLIEKLAVLRQAVFGYTERRIPRQRARRRMDRLVVTFWLALHTHLEDHTETVGGMLDRIERGEIVIGNKTPSTEFVADFYLDAFRASRPNFVYCMRHPRTVFESRRNLPWAQKSIRWMTRKYVESVRLIEAVRAKFPNHVFISRIDQVGRGIESRLDHARHLFEFLGLDFGEASERFVRDWPTVTSAKDRIAEGKWQTLSSFERSYMRLHRPLRQVLDRYGYELEP